MAARTTRDVTGRRITGFKPEEIVPLVYAAPLLRLAVMRSNVNLIFVSTTTISELNLTGSVQ